ncbi:MAG: hypothetical protein JRI58_12805 [Deltaproteobacteria bacterium]|nr:hypothetical protein [Deltaproteobacteria bacterium]RLB81356.1 MAG: hypothetical protein DRH17_09420 [Deltaproteobacteria bacterium]
MRNIVSTVSRCLIVLMGVFMVAWGGSLQAEPLLHVSGYISGTVDLVYSAGGYSFIQVSGRSFLVNTDTRVDIMQGKQLIENAPLRSLRYGSQVHILVSDLDGKPWAKKITAYETESNAPVRSGQISVPMVRPK